MPNWLIFVLVMTVILGPLLGFAVYLLLRQKRMQQQMYDAVDGTVGEQTCVACGSGNVSHPEPDIVHCDDCGYDGGDGIARRKAEQKAQHIQSLPPTERLQSAHGDLNDAKLHLEEAMEASQYLSPDQNLDLVGMMGWTANSGEYGEGGEVELAQRVSQLVRSITRMETSLHSAVDAVGSIQPHEQPPGFAFDQWRLAILLHEYDAAHAQRGTAGDVAMALAAWVLPLQQHLQLFAAP